MPITYKSLVFRTSEHLFGYLKALYFEQPDRAHMTLYRGGPRRVSMGPPRGAQKDKSKGLFYPLVKC